MQRPEAEQHVFVDGVEDTPSFRLRVSELEGNGRRLKERCSTLVTGLRKYKDVMASVCHAQVAFGTLLQDFYQVDQADGGGAGSVPVPKFVAAFKELASYFDLLKIQLDYTADTLQVNWVEGLLDAVPDTHKAYERRQADFEDAQHKYLSLKRVTKREVVEKAAAELQVAKQQAQESRAEVARQLNEMECRRRYAFLEVLLDSVAAHTNLFRNGHDVLQRLGGPVLAASATVQRLKRDEGDQMRVLDASILSARRLAATRSLAAAEDAAGPDAASAATGPLQMAANQQVLNRAIQEQIAATMASDGAQVTALKQGYLQKKSTSMGGKLVEWKRRFFVLDSQGLLYYYSQKDSLLNRMVGQQKQKPQNTVQLLTSTVKLDDDDPNTRFAFRLISPEGIYCLQADSAAERTEWVEAVQAVINCLLNGHIDDPSLEASAPSTSGGGAGPGRHRRSVSVGMVVGTPLGAAVAAMAAAAGQSPPTGGDRGASGGGGSIVGGFRPRLRTPGGSMSSGLDFAGSPAPAAPLERLRRPAGNLACAECGAPDPDWASLNLGILLCIECSGLHRQMGVHVSKVRSCTLDVKVWEHTVLELFDAIGNDYANSVWEVHVGDVSWGAPATAAQALAAADPFGVTRTGSATGRPAGAAGAPGAATGGGGGADDWVWCEDDDQAPPAESTAALSKRMLIEGRSKGPPASKPTMRTPLLEKQRFVVDKYVGRRFVEPLEPAKAQQLLWDAVEKGSIRLSVRALAGGADLTAPCRFPKSAKLAQDTNALAATFTSGSGGFQRAGGSGRFDATVLHAAAASGHPVCMELILQNNAPYEVADAFGRTPLHYCILYDAVQSAKLLLKRGASLVPDFAGNTPFDLAMARGKVADEELFVLLSTASSK